MITRLNTQSDVLAREEHKGMLALYHLATRTLLWRIEAHEGNLTALDWRPDGAMLASGGDDGRMHLWRTSTGEQVWTLTQASPIQQVRWSWDGSQIAVATKDGVTVWQPLGGPFSPLAFEDGCLPSSS